MDRWGERGEIDRQGERDGYMGREGRLDRQGERDG